MSLISIGVQARRFGQELAKDFKPFKVPRTPRGGELPVSALIGNAHGIAEWKLFLNE